MAKRLKQAANLEKGSASASEAVVTASQNPAVIQTPAKHPTLLAVSLSLFALWFVFLLVTALFG